MFSDVELVCEEAEIDEQWSFVGNKFKQRWIWFRYSCLTTNSTHYRTIKPYLKTLEIGGLFNFYSLAPIKPAPPVTNILIKIKTFS
ncbi:MAG: hypothetical protein GQ532_07165 [Methylomarinum sp.]|nr:hypothetical protein [Methylomarinum sp.]